MYLFSLIGLIVFTYIGVVAITCIGQITYYKRKPQDVLNDIIKIMLESFIYTFVMTLSCAIYYYSGIGLTSD